MLVAVADTHALIWHFADDERLSARANEVFAEAASTGGRIGVSTISIVEIIYLEEKQRILPMALHRLDNMLAEPNAVLLELPIDRLIAMSVNRVDRLQVPELPDRILAATALVHGVPLITRDGMITSSDIQTIW